MGAEINVGKTNCFFYQLATTPGSSRFMSLEGTKNETEDMLRIYTLFGGQQRYTSLMKTRIRKFISEFGTRPISFQREQPE
jgi:hypothetical protein